MTWYLDTALAMGVLGLGTGAPVPRLIARVPEPAPDPVPVAGPEPVPSEMQPAVDEADFSRPLDDPKEPYAEVAALPGLWWKCALGSAVAAGAMGAQVGWHPILALLAFLTPVCAALTVVDWRTRFLPTALIAPSYVVAAVLAVLASLLSGDWSALKVSAIGWVATFAVFFVLWFVYPRGLGYGDVRLSGLLAIPLGWLGVAPLLLGIYTGFLLGAVGGMLLSVLRVFHRKHYPFGPFMVLGAWLGVVATAPLGAAYGWVIQGLVDLVS
jgi:leader peptidase (prepilin peptidase)/N-methyltransferase